MSEETPAEQPAAPMLRVVGSDATAEEVAALVAVFSSLGGGEPAAPAPTPAWRANHSKVRAHLQPGTGAWRASALPR